MNETTKRLLVASLLEATLGQQSATFPSRKLQTCKQEEEMTTNFDETYAAYERYVSNRKPGDPFFTFSGWLQHGRIEELGATQLKCLTPHQHLW